MLYKSYSDERVSTVTLSHPEEGHGPRARVMKSALGRKRQMGRNLQAVPRALADAILIKVTVNPELFLKRPDVSEVFRARAAASRLAARTSKDEEQCPES